MVISCVQANSLGQVDLPYLLNKKRLMQFDDRMQRKEYRTMGRFLNPDEGAFRTARNSSVYVDKTGLIQYTNEAIGTDRAFICNSRPRRFGKSMTANMLAAYYSRGCDSSAMFADLTIAQQDGYREHQNHYDVIHFDVQWFLGVHADLESIVDYIQSTIMQEIRQSYSDVLAEDTTSVASAMSQINAATGNRFVVIIDEWDVLIRDQANDVSVQREYINFLRGLFKGTEPTKYIALAYLTGILPIKRMHTQSALNNFDEFTMLDAGELAPFVGFTEDEVRQLCEQYGRDFAQVKRWYDGYVLDGYHVYNPRAVVCAMTRGRFKSYWSQTGTYESIVPLIGMDYDGLRTAIIEMLSGEAVPVDVSMFQNDVVSFDSKDDVLTYLIHLGYLAYDEDLERAFVPNEEIRQELLRATRKNAWSELNAFQNQSRELLMATLDQDGDTVAAGIERIHTEYASAIQYHDENSLSSVLTIAYLSSMQYYFKPIRELPTGRGFADFVYIPKPEYIMDYPALVVELKWNQSAHTALEQIRERDYPQSLVQYTGEILLVGISYDKTTKRHTCVIERYER